MTAAAAKLIMYFFKFSTPVLFDWRIFAKLLPKYLPSLDFPLIKLENSAKRMEIIREDGINYLFEYPFGPFNRFNAYIKIFSFTKVYKYPIIEYIKKFIRNREA